MRMKLISDVSYPNRCTLEYSDACGHRIARDFFAPAAGGYVREDWTNPRQVCENLFARGSTLVWYPSAEYPTLAHCIRAEYRALIRAMYPRDRSARRHAYTTDGPVRGSCGHRHQSEATAARCLEKDRKGCRSQGGFSDRRILPAPK